MSEFTDTELLNRLETILRKSVQSIEFWVNQDGRIMWASDERLQRLNCVEIPDEEARIMWASNEPGDTLRQALTKLVTDV